MHLYERLELYTSTFLLQLSLLFCFYTLTILEIQTVIGIDWNRYLSFTVPAPWDPGPEPGSQKPGTLFREP